MSEDLIDSMLNEETLTMLDKHSKTIDKLDGILSKVDSIISKPLISDVFEILKNKAVGKVEEQVIDPWDCMIGGIEAPTAPRPAPVQQQITAAPIAKSELHSEMHNAIDEMNEEQIMELINSAGNKPESTVDTDTEYDPEDVGSIGSEGSGEVDSSGTDGETSEV